MHIFIKKREKEEKIEIEKPLLNFTIIYPEILENKKYPYNITNNKIYIFEVFNNSKVKLIHKNSLLDPSGIKCNNCRGPYPN